MLTIVVTSPAPPGGTKESIEREGVMHFADVPGARVRVVEGEPVILAGLVKGGEFPGLTEWFANATRDMLCLAADGRIVNGWDHAKDAEVRGALPITWYRYPEAP